MLTRFYTKVGSGSAGALLLANDLKPLKIAGGELSRGRFELEEAPDKP